MQFDVFNGDADGICALIQLRLAQPIKASLVTGIKRDIKLLDRVHAAKGDNITVLDISLAKNNSDLNKLLNQGAKVFYIDHHNPGEIPSHPALTTLIDTDANMCTSLLVNQHLNNQFPAWAVTAAFGDNLFNSANQLAANIGLSEQQTEQLKLLGTCINYNAYGSSIEDLHFAPDQLYKEMAGFESPFDFIRQNQTIHQQLLNGYQDDLNKARQIKPEYCIDSAAVYLLPDQIWARRISGVFGNLLANQYPDRAHAIISINQANDYQISVRAPLTNKTGADELCASFPTGGGRKAAAGINHLEKDQLEEFIRRFEQKYSAF